MEEKEITFNDDELTPKQKLFCSYYITEARFNGTKAYKLAFTTKDKKPSDNTAKVNACKLLKNEAILSYIRVLQQEMINNIKITKETLISQILEVMDYSMNINNRGVMNSPQTALKCIIEIAKLLGYENEENKEEESKETTIIVDDIF